jgi:hypothetical protein
MDPETKRLKDQFETGKKMMMDAHKAMSERIVFLAEQLTPKEIEVEFIKKLLESERRLPLGAMRFEHSLAFHQWIFKNQKHF